MERKRPKALAMPRIESSVMEKSFAVTFFSIYEWCMTDKYDPNNKKHGLPDIIDTRACLKAMSQAGFEILSIRNHGKLH